MTKTTPGPWTVKEEWGRSLQEAEQGIPAVLCFHSIRAGDDPIASTWGGPNMENAHLIAAAPDLLAALKKAERYVWEVACETEDGVHTLREDLPEAKLWKEIVAAISKAEGKDHD